MKGPYVKRTKKFGLREQTILFFMSLYAPSSYHDQLFTHIFVCEQSEGKKKKIS